MDGFAYTPPPLRKPVVLDQYWDDLTFVHWPVEPESVAHLYPSGARPDVFDDGYTYVALVPFYMRSIALGPTLPPVPYFGSFAETNIRLYSIDDEGRHGVLFRSLETERAAVVPITRAALGIPYTWARMSIDRAHAASTPVGDEITYDSTRRWPDPGLRSRLRIRVGEAVEPTPLETWLTARWGAHTRALGRTLWVPNEHPPWPLHVAEVLELSDDLLGASGVAAAGEPLRALFSPGVRTRFGRPSMVDPG
ncbi:DUF2071 domain-containing protein [Williamsia sp. CHRR-6]|nr:DUF2071 domain-containing protein [Williamsia sp. CHRR-6]